MRASCFMRGSLGYCEDLGLKLEHQLLLSRSQGEILGVLAESSNGGLGFKCRMASSLEGRGQICPWIPDLSQLSPHSNPPPFHFLLEKVIRLTRGWVKNQGVCKHPLNENTWTFWVNVPKWFAVASKKRASELRGTSHMRAVCWKSGQLCTPGEDKADEMGRACCLPCVVPHCLHRVLVQRPREVLRLFLLGLSNVWSFVPNLNGYSNLG